MQAGTSTPSWHLGALWRLPLRELHLSWRFTGRDVRTNIIPPLIFTLAVLRHAWPITLTECAWALLRVLVYFWFYSYTFCLPSQIVGVEEDRINKPERPLPAGLVSVRGAYYRYFAALLIYAGLGLCFGVLKWTLLWEAVTVLYVFGGFHRHWFTKNVVSMTLGTVAQLAAAWELVAPLTATTFTPVLTVAFMAGVTALVQDFRDVAGDRLIGRRTMPITIGELPARWVVIGIFLLSPLATYYGLLAGERPLVRIGCAVVLAAHAYLIAARVAIFRSAVEDHKTYIIYSYWYCAILVARVIGA